jgi:hypothetical protein
VGARQEREGHRFGQAEAGQCAACIARPPLLRRQRQHGHGALALQRHGWDVVVAVDTDDLLDEVGLALNVAAPGRRAHLQVIGLARHLESEIG